MEASYVVYYEPETSGWVAYNPETDVASQGETREDALSMLREALELYYEDGPTNRREEVRSLGTGRLKLA